MDLAEFLEETPPQETAYIRLIFSSQPSKEFIEEISRVVKDGLSREVQLSFETDPSLIAGGILRFENELIDGSLQGQVRHFQQRYQEIV